MLTRIAKDNTRSGTRRQALLQHWVSNLSGTSKVSASVSKQLPQRGARKSRTLLYGNSQTLGVYDQGHYADQEIKRQLALGIQPIDAVSLQPPPWPQFISSGGKEVEDKEIKGK